MTNPNLAYRIIINVIMRRHKDSIGHTAKCKGCTLPLGDREKGRQLICDISYISHNNGICFEMMKDIYVSSTDASNQKGIS
jgi:hypothetical protein